MNSAYLLLGSNEGDRLGWLQSAKESINNSIGNITAASSIYETAAWGLEEQPSFYNQVILTTTLLEPRELLHVVNQIELENGRQRVLKWGQRTLDIDILFFNEQVISEPDLRIPHPFMEQRRFTLAPLAEIAGNFTHPISGHTVSHLLQHCPDNLSARKLAAG